MDKNEQVNTNTNVKPKKSFHRNFSQYFIGGMSLRICEIMLTISLKKINL